MINQSAEWAALMDERARVGDIHLREHFQTDPARGTDMTVEAGDPYLDYSKNRLTSVDRSLPGRAVPRRHYAWTVTGSPTAIRPA